MGGMEVDMTGYFIRKDRTLTPFREESICWRESLDHDGYESATIYRPMQQAPEPVSEIDELKARIEKLEKALRCIEEALK